MKTFIRRTSAALTVVAILMLLIGGSFVMLNYFYTVKGPLQETKTIAIPRGEGRLNIAARLEREGVIWNRWAFVLNHLGRNLLFEDRGDLKAGEYRFEPGARMSDVLRTVLSGRSFAYKVTFPEGFTSQQIVERLKQHESLTGEITQIPPEGSLLPSTYTYSAGTDRQSILDQMAAEQQDFLARVWEKRAEGLPFNSPQEALILASIVEKETGQSGERPHVASVFINRLKKGMRLQSDPTIIYGIVGGKGSLGRPIYKSDIRTTTPYNTYRINGLPPTPIANPGKAAILAVLNPLETNDLYFVADGTGGHTFSETLSEHNAAVRKWREIERQRRAAQEKAVSKPQTPPIAAADGSAALPLPTKADDSLREDSGREDSGEEVEEAAAPASPPPAEVGSVSRVPLPVRAPR